jgi:MFS family permease
METNELTESDIQSDNQSSSSQKDGIELCSPSPSSHITFDVILDRVGFGKYHYKLFVILGLLGIADGSSGLVLSFVLPLFKKQFQPKFDFQAILGALLYIGCLFGSLSSGYFSDKYGRRWPILYSSLIMLILGSLCSYPLNLLYFIFLQTIFGYIVGIFSPVALTIMAEITPLKYRGKYMVLLGINRVIGQILCVFVHTFTFTNLEYGNWHALMICSVSVPAFFGWVGALFFLDESARHEMILGNYANGINILKKMYRENKGLSAKNLMSRQEEKQLIETFSANKRIEYSTSPQAQNPLAQLPLLFSGLLKRATPFIWLNWFTISLTFFGITYLLPTTYLLIDKQQAVIDAKKSVTDLIYPVLMEISSILVAAKIVDMKGFGRRNSLAGTLLLGGFFCILFYCQIPPSFIFWISSAKFFFAVAFALNYQLTSELYPTRVRGTGIGIASSFGRAGGLIIPYVTKVLTDMNVLLPYFVFGLFSMGAGVGTLLLPFDTSNLVFSEIDAK